jgi:hypothetical protein
MADITYILKDPTVPNLAVPVNFPPAQPNLKIKVEGFVGATPSMYTMEHQAAMCYHGITHAINLMNKFSKRPVPRWSFVDTLLVQPRAGNQLNAFYDRHALRFFFAMDPVQKNLVYTCNSAEVVLHETGHALLDAIRPDLYNVLSYEVWGIHEAFGDIHSMINSLNYDLMLDTMLDQTKGNLRQSNIVTMLANQMGRMVYGLSGGRMGYSGGYLRDAVNNFTYVLPESLPRSGMYTQLTREPHNFSRIFSGAWWDILCGMYEMNKAAGMDQKAALISARDVLTGYTYNAIPYAAATIRFFDAFAKAMLLQDKVNNHQYNAVMNDVFIKRRILRQPVLPMAALDWTTFKAMVNQNDHIVETPEFSMVRSKNIEQLTLPDHMLQVEAPNDTYYEFDKDGNCVEVIATSGLELIDHARSCVDFLKENGMIRPDSLAPFEITADGTLVRSNFAGCFLNNGTDPNQPEYLKAWKPENNAGCGCSSKKKTVCNSTKRSVLIQANTRLNVNGCGFSSTSSSGSGVSFGFPASTISQPSC